MDEDYYDQDDGPRSPGLEKSKIYYAPKESPPPFLVDKGSDSEAPKKFADEGTSQDCSRKRQQPSKPGTTEGNSVLIRHLDPNRPDIAAYERSHPLSEDLRHEDDFLLNKTQLRRPDPPLPTDESPKPPSDLNEAAKSALSLLLGKEAPKPEEATPLPLVLPPVGAADSPPKKELFKTLLNDDHDSIKREPDTPPISQPSSNPYAPEANAPEAKRVKSESPLSRFIIPTSEASTQNLLPALDSPDNSHTLPSLQTALGLQNVPPKDPARPNGSSPFSLPPVTATSPPGLRTETAWEHQRAGPFGAQIPPSPYSHWSPASTTARDLSAVSSPASQNSHWRSLKSDISYLKSPYEVPPPAAKSPATSYPTPTDQTPASTCDRTPYNAPTPSNGAAVSTGAFKCGWPGCNAPPFQTQYLLK